MKQRKTLYNWLTYRYQLTVREEENLAERATINFTYARLIVLLFSIFLLAFVLNFFIVRAFSPSGVARTGDVELDRHIVELSMQVDSLAKELESKDRFIHSFQGLVSDKVEPVKAAEPANQSKVAAVNMDAIDPVDSAFRREFEEADYELTSIKSNQKDLQKLFLFPPVNGVLLQKFDSKKKHYGVDIAAQKNEPIKCVADGSVILSSWTQDSGHVVAVQHKNQLISFYKHNSVLLKKVGDMVKAGDVVSIIGNSGEFTDGPHLHFELWYNGNPINPEEFVSF